MNFPSDDTNQRWTILHPSLNFIGEHSCIIAHENRYVLVPQGNDQILIFDSHTRSTYYLPRLQQLSLLCSVAIVGDYYYMLTWIQDHVYRIKLPRQEDSKWEKMDWMCPVNSTQCLASLDRNIYSFSYEGNAMYNVDNDQWSTMPKTPRNISITVAMVVGQVIFVGGKRMRSELEFIGCIWKERLQVWEECFMMALDFYCAAAVGDNLLVLVGRENEEERYLTFFLYDLTTRERRRSHVVYQMQGTDDCIGMLRVAVVGEYLVLAESHLESIPLDYLLNNSNRVEL